MNKIAKRPKQFQDAYVGMYPDLDKTDLPVKNITFCVTYDCTLNCTYCYEKHKCGKSMSFETGRKAIDMLFEEDRKNGRYINKQNAQAVILDFIGGEPLLEIDLIDELTDYFKDKAIKLNHRWAINHQIMITSNGTLYDNPKVQRYLKKNTGRAQIKITIDGNKDLHDSCRKFPDGCGSYDIVEPAFIKHMNITEMRDTKLTLAPDNVPYFFEACSHLFNIGAEHIFANCVFEEGWDIPDAVILYDQMKQLADWLLEDNHYEKYTCTMFDPFIGTPMTESSNENWCGGVGKMLAISPEGDLYPCLRYLPFCTGDKVKPLIIGDVEHGIEHNCDQCAIVDMLNKIDRRTQSTDECYYCPIASGCAWCSAYNYERTGTPDKRVTYICIMHKARVLANSYYWNKLYKLIGEQTRIKNNIPKEWALQIINEEEYEMLNELSN